MPAPASRRLVLHLALVDCRPEISLEMPVTLNDWKREIGDTARLIDEVSHELSDHALTSSVEMEVMGTR
ncbi:hypothetical protein [Onishia taeanensis]|nr:hypothetical protein [Halomonas taeanensis]